MKYPNSTKTYQNNLTHGAGNRGMSLEEDINKTNETYLLEDVAIIHKKPTPITIVKVDYPRRSAAKITEAYFKVPSTTDYNGIYKGKYLDFEAKECNSKTSFPFSSIHKHQITHLNSVLKHGAIAFIIIRLTAYNKDFLITAESFISFYNSTKRKSLPFDWIIDNGYPITFKLKKPCDYLKIVDEIFNL